MHRIAVAALLLWSVAAESALAQDVMLQVVMVKAKQHGESDPELRPLRPRLRRLVGYRSYRMVGRQERGCQWRAEQAFLLPGGQVLVLQPVRMTDQRVIMRAPRVWLNSSSATIYRHTLTAAMDEAGETGATLEAKDEFSVEVIRQWERALDEAQTPVTRKVALRITMVFGAAGGVFPVLRRLARCGLGGRMGNGRQFVSWIHIADFLRATEWLLAKDDFNGPVNLAAPQPLPNAEMMQRMREAVDMPFGLPATRWMLEVGAVFLRTETELILKSRRVVPGRLLAAGFQFQFPDMRAALSDLA